MTRPEGTTLQFDVFHLPSGVDLLYRHDDVVPLEPRAVRVLRYLVTHHDRVVSKEEVLEEVWSDVFTTDGVLKKAVSQIRRVLGDDAERSRFIATYHGRGYRFIAPVTPQAAAAQPAPPKPASAPAELIPSPAELIPSYDQLAARDAELRTLRAELRSAMEGAPRPVVIVGEAGIGKTQLVRHFRRWSAEQGAVSLYGRFFDYRGARLAPYELFIDLLRSAIGAAESGEPLRDALATASGVRLPAELFAESSRDGETAGAGSVGDHFRFVVPIVRCWLALSRQQPMIIVFDDLQWADPASLDVIGCLLRMLDSQRLMPIMVLRSDDPESAEQPVHAWLAEQAARRTYTTLPLGRLDRDECREVIGAIFGIRRAHELPRRDVDTLFRVTDGNPYFLVETLRLLVNEGVIVPEPSNRTWLWKGMRDVSLPETILTAARAKIDRLPERVRGIVEQAAVIGDEFHFATLRHLTGRAEAEVEEVLSEGVRRGVLSIQGLTPGEECRFQHSILRHVVYDAIPPHRRRALHARAAEALEAVYGAHSDRMAEALAAHYAAAGDRPRSFEAGMRAWRAARGRSEWRKASALIERARETSETLDLAAADHMDLLLALGETWCVVGRVRESASALDEAAALAGKSGDGASLARALFLRGLTAIALSNYDEARAALSQALDYFLENQIAPAISRTLVHLAAVEAATGRYERASSLVDELRAGQASENLAALADGIVGWSLALRGRYSEAEPLLRRALEYHDRIGAIRERALLLRRLHWTALSRGNYDDAIELAIRAREDFSTSGDSSGEAKANMSIGQARLAQGQHEEAVSFLTLAIEQLESIGDAHCQAECLWLLGRARYETGALDEGGSLLTRALTMTRQIGDRDDQFRILIDLARLAILREDFALAREQAASARTIAESLQNREGAALATVELARIELARGNPAEAASIARHATSVLEELQSSERWRAEALAPLLAASGE